jgi:uncharacterized membrane protein
MAWSVRLAGHAVHPMLVHFPITLWFGAVVADVGGWMTAHQTWWAVSFACHVLGLATATVAMIFGMLDFVAMTHNGPHAGRDTAVNHILAMGAAWLLFFVSLALRGMKPMAAPPIWATAAALLALAAMIFGAWAGGRLVYTFGVGGSRSSSSRGARA